MRKAFWSSLTKQEKEVYKLTQFQQYYKTERRDDGSIIVTLERRSYPDTSIVVSAVKYEVTSTGVINHVNEGEK